MADVKGASGIEGCELIEIGEDGLVYRSRLEQLEQCIDRLYSLEEDRLSALRLVMHHYGRLDDVPERLQRRLDFVLWF